MNTSAIVYDRLRNHKLTSSTFKQPAVAHVQSFETSKATRAARRFPGVFHDRLIDSGEAAAEHFGDRGDVRSAHHCEVISRHVVNFEITGT